MSGIHDYGLFIITAFILIVTPGIDTVFVLNKSISQGRKAGVYASLGVNSGILVHTIFAALGLSLLVSRSAMAFQIVKYLGALYLVYLGIKTLFSKEKSFNFDKNKLDKNAIWENYRSGMVTNVLNPKVALFFLSFFPQFICKEWIEFPRPFLLLGLTYALLGTIWYVMLACFSSHFSRKIKEGQRFHFWLHKFSGVIYILMGAKIALTKK